MTTSVFEHPSFHNHENVHFFNDRSTGLKGILCIHTLVEGSTGGGCRFYPYQNSYEALTDVLRLSRAMTYKFALSGIPLGGGKSVIIGDPGEIKNEALLEAFGEVVDSFKGKYIVGGDVGTNEEDMKIIRRKTRFVAGVKGEGGDTAPLTAFGVFRAMKAAIASTMKKDRLKGMKIAIQGLGGVGMHVLKYVVGEGAHVIATDINPVLIGEAQELGSVEIVAPGEILFQNVDVLVPCALGGILTKETIPKIQAAIICGGANNQLADESLAHTLEDSGIVFVPDFVASAGGAIHGAGYLRGMSQSEIEDRVGEIYTTTTQVLTQAARYSITPLAAAYHLAEEILEQKTNGYKG